MKTTIKNTIKAVVLALGLFAVGANAATFTNCDEVKEITANLVAMKLVHEDVKEYTKAAWAIADKFPNKYDRYVFMGMANMVWAREQRDPLNLANAPRDYKKVCEEMGPEKIAEEFYNVWAD